MGEFIVLPKIRDVRLPAKIHVTSPLRFDWVDINSKSAMIGLESKESKPRNAIFLGKVNETGTTRSFYNYNLWLAIDFPHIILICGKRGTGKSYTLGAMAEGLIASDQVSTVKDPSYSVLIIDTLGQFWQTKYPPIPKDPDGEEQLSLLKEWGLQPKAIENVNVFIPRGCSQYFPYWKVFSIRVSDLDLDDWCGLLGVDRYYSRMGQLMSQAYEKVVEKGYMWVKRDLETGAILESKRVEPKETYAIDDLIECLDHDQEINSKITGFETKTIRALRSRLADLRTWKVFDEKGSSIEDIFKRGTITIMNLQEVDYALKSLVVGILVKKIFKARIEATASEEAAKIDELKKEYTGIPPGWLLIDEAHNYCPEAEITAAKNWLIRYAKEGRSLGLGLIVTTQQPSALSNKLSSQINILISHGLAFSQDVSAVEARLLNEPPESIRLENETIDTNILRRVLRSLERGDAVISASGVNRIFCAQVRPRLAMHGGGPPKFG